LDNTRQMLLDRFLIKTVNYRRFRDPPGRTDGGRRPFDRVRPITRYKYFGTRSGKRPGNRTPNDPPAP
jgi:hypothetical protein